MCVISQSWAECYWDSGMNGKDDNRLRFTNEEYGDGITLLVAF